MLVPVIGVIQVGVQARADRYTYLPHVGLFLAVVWGLAEVVGCQLSVVKRVVGTAGVAGVLVCCAVLTVRQIPVWYDTQSLWSHALAVVPGNWFASQALAKWELGQERKAEAIEILMQAAQSRPDSDLLVLNCLGKELANYGAYEAGDETLTRAIALHPEVAELYGNRGKILAAEGKWPAALADYREAVRLAPTKASYRYYLAHALSKTGEAAESENEYLAGIRLDSKWPERAAEQAWQGATDPNPVLRNGAWAVQLAEQANEARQGQRPKLLDVLAAALAEAGRFDDAVATAERAIAVAEKAGQEDLAAAIRQQRDLYRLHKPFRSS